MGSAPLPLDRRLIVLRCSYLLLPKATPSANFRLLKPIARVMLLPNHIREDLRELARLAAAVTEAHTCAVFLPSEFIQSSHLGARSTLSKRPEPASDTITLKQVLEPGIDPKRGSIDLVAIHSYSKLARDCRIQVGSGLLGWVADQGRPIHLAPFDVTRTSIGIYVDPEPIKSLVAVPIFLTESSQAGAPEVCGVLMCDSLNPEGFKNAHVKILEQLAGHTARFLAVAQAASQVAPLETAWDLFKEKVLALGEAIGSASVELSRIRIASFGDLEHMSGMSTAVQLTEQFVRLAQQALPPHFPLIKLPNGEVLIALDNMMSAFFQQKLQTLADHLSSSRKPFSITCESFGAKLDSQGRCDLDATLQQKPLTRRSSPSAGGSRA